MKIAVCMKQVPKVSEGKMDAQTGVLLRDGLGTTVNVYDLAALEAALRIKDLYGDTVIDVFTMGPIKAEDVLGEAYAMGADQGYLVCDPAFAGADVLATSYTLMQAIKSVGGYDLILCGRQTTDGDTAQVSGALARWLSMPHINWVQQIIAVTQEEIEVCSLTEHEKVYARCCFPCLISVEKDCFIPRMPSLKLRLAAKKNGQSIRLTLADLQDKEKEHYGLKGSATLVKKIYSPHPTGKQPIMRMQPQDAARYIADVLRTGESGAHAT